MKIKVKNIALAIALGFGMSTVCDYAEAGKLTDFINKAKGKIANSKIVKKVTSEVKKEISNELIQKSEVQNLEEEGSALDWGNKLKNLTAEYSESLGKIRESIDGSKLASSSVQSEITKDMSDTINNSSTNVYIQDCKSELAAAEQIVNTLITSVSRYLNDLQINVTVHGQSAVAKALGLVELASKLNSKTSDLSYSCKKVLSSTGSEMNMVAKLEELGTKINRITQILCGLNTSFSKGDLSSF